jgi:two-component system sensor histidine kinase KdpD
VRFTLPSSDGGSLGVLVVEFAGPPSERARRVLASIAGQLALAIERQVHSLAAHENAVRVEAERLRTNLLATVSHDLRTPLSAICGTASALLEGGEAIPPAEARELLGEILGESERMARLVENLLQLARMEGNVQVHKQLYPLDELLGAAVARLGRGVGTGRVRFELEDGLPLVPVDAELMTSVFQNLLENALRYAPLSDVLVRASSDQHAVRVEVLDRGPGLPADEPQRLFERFFRGRSAADRTRGSGLGLAICKAVMRAHDGWIRAEGRPGGGACFLLELPLSASAPGPAGQLQGIAGAP